MENKLWMQCLGLKSCNLDKNNFSYSQFVLSFSQIINMQIVLLLNQIEFLLVRDRLHLLKL
jgi:hypothetical protein